jgi:hypothetical protein
VEHQAEHLRVGLYGGKVIRQVSDSNAKITATPALQDYRGHDALKENGLQVYGLTGAELGQEVHQSSQVFDLYLNLP